MWSRRRRIFRKNIWYLRLCGYSISGCRVNVLKKDPLTLFGYNRSLVPGEGSNIYVLERFESLKDVAQMLMLNAQ